MSWYIDQIGTRAAVKAKVLESTRIPHTIKQVIVDIINDPSSTAPNGIRLRGHGHQGGGSWNVVGELSVQPVDLVL